MSEKVVVTGMGMISSLGFTMERSWKNLIDGKSGVGMISRFDASSLLTRIAAEVPPDFEEFSRGYIKKRQAGQMTRVTRMCVTASKMAVEDASIDFTVTDRRRCAVIIGAVNTGNSSVEKGTTLQNSVFKNMSNSMAAWVSMEYQLYGPSFSVNTACASSAYAMALGFDMISRGTCDLVIAGGADSIVNPEEISGFNALYALSTSNDPPEQASKPFSRDRDGFVIGEGAGVVILESLSHATRRHARIHGEFAGYATTSEGYNIMAPAANGEGMAYTMNLALLHAGIDPEKVDYINAHGTSTELNDRFETLAIKKVFGDRAGIIPVSSSKSMIGHTIGAAGAIEAIITILALKEGILPPTINYRIPDPDLDLDYIPNTARQVDARIALSNSFGFGGHNATLVFRKFPF